MAKSKISDAARFLITSFVILLLATVVLSGFCTDWGKVKITRVTLQAADGNTISSIMYVPKTATRDNPAAAAICLHGRSNTSHVTHTWATEMARRGYVVISPDMNGGGESDVIDDRTDIDYANIVADYLSICEFVKRDKIFYAGFSAGATRAITAGNLHADTCAGIIACAPVRLPKEPAKTNILLLKAQNDQYNFAFGCGPRELYETQFAENMQLDVDKVESGVIYGSFEDKTGVQYVFCPTIIHQMSDVTPTGISAMLNFMMQIEEPVNYIDPADTVWQWQQVASFVAAIAFMASVCALGNCVTSIEWFAKDIKNPLPANRGARGTKYAFSVFLAVIIPMVLFIPVSAKGMGGWFESNTIMRSKNLNGVMVALLTVSLVNACIMLFKMYRKKKAGTLIVLSDYALAPEGAGSIHWIGVLKSLLAAFIVVVAAFVWLYFVEEFGGTNYQCWRVIVINRFNILRITATIPYICCIFVILFFAGIGMNTERRLDDSKNLAACMLINALIAAGGVGLLLIIQYGGSVLSGTGQAVFAQQTTGAVGGTSVGALDFAVGFPFIIGSMAAINTYFFRKTGNIWTGTLIGAVLAASMATTQFTFVC
jgi:dienelactone hydrolase